MGKGFKTITLAMAIYTCGMALMPTAEAWTDQTHLAIAKAGGLASYHNACAPDVSHTVAFMNKIWLTESPAHYFDATAPLTRKDVAEQMQMIGMSRKKAPDGYLLGAIVNAVREAKARTEKGEFDDYYYAVLAHYIGDLSMPLHMSAYDDFNKSHHLQIDDTLTYKNVEWEVDGAGYIANELKVDDGLRFNSEAELVNHMLEIANESYSLAQKLRGENRNLTREEAIQRASRSATMLRAVMRYCGKRLVRNDKNNVLRKAS